MGCIGATARAALPLILGLILCAAPQAARAGACRDAELLPGCVNKNDIARDSLRAVDIKNESQGYFHLGQDAFRIPGKLKPYAQVTLTPHSDGWVMINASATIGAGVSTSNREAEATIFCQFKIGRRFSTARIIFGSEFRGSVSPKFQPSVAGTSTAKVAGGKTRTIFLACERFEGEDLAIFRPAITVAFHPVKY